MKSNSHAATGNPPHTGAERAARDTGPADRPLVKGSLTAVYVFSIAVALIMAGVATVGLLYPTLAYPTEGSYRSFLPTDMANLAVGLPLLVASLVLVRCGKAAGLLCLPGALFFVTYTYTAYVIGVPVSLLFPLYAALVVLSACGIVALLARIDHEALSRRLSAAAPVRTAGGILAGLGILILLRQAGLVFDTVTQKTDVPLPELALWVADLTIAVPVLVATGTLLWRRRPVGYVAGANLLLSYGALSVGLIPVMIMQAGLAGAPVDAVGIAVVLVMAMLCLIPYRLFMRAL
ncbi:MAG: hypothetical protein GF331_22040 [Chitinivibrionales bacterium]|nr:hypothetical protein [Chitinivibrionales bacterium]